MREALVRGAEELGIKLTESEILDLAAFCIHEWGGAPRGPEELRNLISAYMHYRGRAEQGKAIEASPLMRGNLLKKMRAFFAGGQAPEVPYEELRCPRCPDTVVVGDLAAIDHYLRHFGEIPCGRMAVKDLSDYRGLGEKNKLRAYMIARSFFIS